MRRPRELYQPSPQSYQEQPREWEYPASCEVKRLDTHGMLEDGGRRWFVCCALAGKRVQVERVNSKLLVSYRHMYIREIDQEHKCTRPLVVKRQDPSAAGPGDSPVALRAPSESPGPEDQT